MTVGELNPLKPDAASGDSDSGHGPTSDSSSSSTSSRIESSENVACKGGGEDYQLGEQFVDATDSFVLTTPKETTTNDKSTASGGTCCSSGKLLANMKSPTQTSDSGHLQGDADNNNHKCDDHYEDAKADAPLEAEAELKARLQETTVVLKMALNNEFAKALEICERRSGQDLYAGLAHAVLSFLRAALTLERSDLQAALSSITKSYEFSSKLRHKTSTASMVMRFLYRPNYNNYTDEEIHAELVHAESLLLWALISFLSDQSIICFVKGALRIRACYQRYKECLYIMDNRHAWRSDEARIHFESGVRMGYGVFNVLMSYLPRRVLRFLEYVGFSGNRSVGVEELEKSIATNDGLRSVFSALIVLTYHSYIENLFGLGNYDSQKVEKLNDLLLVDYPNSAFFLLFRGRYYQMLGDLPGALDSYQKCIDAQDDWKQFHAICHWEMMWCYAVQMDWKMAAHYSDLLRKRSKWSAASYTYQYGTFLYAQLVEDERLELCSPNSPEYKKRMAEIRKTIEQVPLLRIRYAGKTIPAEKFAITRSAKFIQRNNRLSLPALEFLYIWNIFVTLRNSPHQVERLLTRIDSEIEHVRKELRELSQNGDHNDDDDDDNTHESNSNNDNQRNSCNVKRNRKDKKEQHKEEEEVYMENDGREDEEEEEINECNDDDYDNWDDDLNLMLLLKGMCLKHLNRLAEAEELFRQIIDNEAKIKLDTFLIPHSAMELGLLKLTLKEYEEAKHWIKIARCNYTGYLLETVVHFRLHAASRQIKLEQEDDTQSIRSNLLDSESTVERQSINSGTQQVSNKPGALVALGAAL